MEGIDLWLVVPAVLIFLIVAFVVLKSIGGKRGGSGSSYSSGGSGGSLLLIIGAIVVSLGIVAALVLSLTGSERERANLAAEGQRALQQSNDRMYVDLQKTTEQNRVLADENSDLRSENVSLRNARDVQMMQLTMPMILVGAAALVLVTLVGGAVYVMIFRTRHAPQDDNMPGQAQLNAAIMQALASIDGRLKQFEGRAIEPPATPYKVRYPPPQLKEGRSTK